MERARLMRVNARLVLENKTHALEAKFDMRIKRRRFDLVGQIHFRHAAQQRDVRTIRAGMKIVPANCDEIIAPHFKCWRFQFQHERVAHYFHAENASAIWLKKIAA